MRMTDSTSFPKHGLNNMNILKQCKGKEDDKKIVKIGGVNNWSFSVISAFYFSLNGCQH
jgi:hypothetical protein